jgi:DNA topoisomerase-1
MARYGAVVQIGTREDEEKPKFAGLRADQRMDTITLEEALELFKLPRDLGETPDGEPVSTNIGRFGPYVRYGKKYVSLKDGDDPSSITAPRALELIAEHKESEANKIIQAFENTEIKVLRGRWGPYITDGKKNAKAPKEREPETLTREECEQMLAAAPEKKPRRAAAAAARKKSTASTKKSKKTKESKKEKE